MSSVGKASHFDDSLKMIRESPEFPSQEPKQRAKDWDPQDESAPWNLASSTKRHIDAQRLSRTQAASFLNFYKGYEATSRMGASKWTQAVMDCFQIYYVPMKTWELVVPQEFLPTEQEMNERFPGLFAADINESFIANSQGKFNFPDVRLRTLCMAIYMLLSHTEKHVPNSRVEELKRQDKKEIYSDALFRKVAEYIGINDSMTTKLILGEQHETHACLGFERYIVSVNEFVFMKTETFPDGTVLGFVEDKRLKSAALADTVAQKAAESLALALGSYYPDKIAVEQPQEVLGVGVRHTFFSFWHSIYSPEYLEAVNRDAGDLGPDHFTWLKTYPVSAFGLDICDPKERMLIFRGLVAIVAYVESGNARIGRY